MNSVIRTSVFLFLMVFIPMSMALHRHAPRPTYVVEAMRAVSSDPSASTTFATKLIAAMPMIVSIGSAAIITWSGILLLGSFMAARTASHARVRRHSAQGQRALTSSVIMVALTNVAVQTTGWILYPEMMDIVILWNWGVFVFLIHLTIAMKRSGVFRCLTHFHLLRTRHKAARAKADALAIRQSETQ